MAGFMTFWGGMSGPVWVLPQSYCLSEPHTCPCRVSRLRTAHGFSSATEWHRSLHLAMTGAIRKRCTRGGQGSVT